MVQRHRLVLALLLMMVWGGSVAGKGKPKVSTLAKCPPSGAEARGGARGLLNEVKHHVPQGAAPAVVLDFSDFATLQQQADAVVKSGPNASPTARDRTKLRNLTVRDHKVGEGDLVLMVGFVVGKASANLGESANCYLKGPANNDFELNVAASPKATPYESVVGEMIPQDRPAEWTLARLHQLAAEGRQVLVTGQLMFDTRHLPNPRRGTNHESPRVSTWEIHPVTKLLACRSVDSTCDPGKEDQWQPLESMR